MYFPKQHYESIVPEKSGINRLSASHDINFIFCVDFLSAHYVYIFLETTITYNETFFP